MTAETVNYLMSKITVSSIFTKYVYFATEYHDGVIIILCRRISHKFVALLQSTAEIRDDNRKPLEKRRVKKSKKKKNRKKKTQYRIYFDEVCGRLQRVWCVRGASPYVAMLWVVSEITN